MRAMEMVMNRMYGHIWIYRWRWPVWIVMGGWRINGLENRI